jgi:predicted anti-sigma-YlaC factor YlaD
MSNVNHISQDDLFLFALQFLPEDEMAAAYDHLQTCDDCRRQVAWIQGDLVSYGMTAEMQSPPEGARERLLRRVAKEKKVMPIGRHQSAPAATPDTPRVIDIQSARPRRLAPVMAWTGWAVAAGVAVAALLQFQQRRIEQAQLASTSAQLSQLTTESAQAKAVLQTLTDEGAKRVVLHLVSAGAPPPPRPEAVATYDATRGSLVMVASNLLPLQDQKVYELWVLPADKSAPIPAGTFRPDAAGHATVVMPPLPKGVAAGAFGVTVEAEGGTDKPTMSTLTLLGE